MGLLGECKKWIIRWMESNRGLIVVLFCLPASFIFDAALLLHKRVTRALRPNDHHDKRVQRIQRQVGEWNKLAKEERKPMCTARPNWLSLSTTFFRKDQCHKVPVPLYDILSLDERARTVRVEPMVTVAEITEYLIPKGYTLAVTLEIGDATLGGLAMGVGMTTHSHKVGLYQETVVAYEVVIGDGSLVRATATENEDLFRALPWSHGSLGFLVALELKLVKVKPYVRLNYVPVRGLKDYCDMVRLVSGALDKDQVAPDYVEATVFSKNEAVIMTGEYTDCNTDDDKRRVNHITRWYKPWFYKHVESFLKKGKGQELIPLREYLLRHNRAIFWVVEAMIPFGNNPIFRFFFGWLLPPKPAFLKFTTTPGIRAMTFTKQVFQDIVLPLTDLERQIEVSEELFDTYPILIYPCRIYDHGKSSGQLRPPRPEQMCPGADWAMFNDLGVYGVPGPVIKKQPFDAVKAMRAMEKFTRDVGGYSFLYADTFMDWNEFNEMFDLTLYEKVRKKYSADGAFPHLYDKIKPEIDVFKVGKEYIDPL